MKCGPLLCSATKRSAASAFGSDSRRVLDVLQDSHLSAAVMIKCDE